MQPVVNPTAMDMLTWVRELPGNWQLDRSNLAQISRRCAVAQYLSQLYGGRPVSCGCRDYTVYKSDGLMSAIGQKPLSAEMAGVVHDITERWGINGNHLMTKEQVITVLEGIVNAGVGYREQGQR